MDMVVSRFQQCLCNPTCKCTATPFHLRLGEMPTSCSIVSYVQQPRIIQHHLSLIIKCRLNAISDEPTYRRGRASETTETVAVPMHTAADHGTGLAQCPRCKAMEARIAELEAKAPG